LSHLPTGAAAELFWCEVKDAARWADNRR